MVKKINALLAGLNYAEKENFLGNDPYDFLNSVSFSFLKNNSLTRLFMTQLFKWSPFNFRRLFQTKKSLGPKEISLLISSYCKLYESKGEKRDLIFSTFLVRGLCQRILSPLHLWGSSFDIQIGGVFSSKSTPNSVSTSFAGISLIDYYRINKSRFILDLIKKVREDIFKVFRADKGSTFFLYSTKHSNIIINQNALVLRFLFLSDKILPLTDNQFRVCNKILSEIILSKQTKEGFWPYNIGSNQRLDFDYHQGFIIEALIDISSNERCKSSFISQTIEKGLHFYKNGLFHSSGRSTWKRYGNWPVDIHDLCQGIVTFSKSENKEDILFADKIVSWTLKNMRDNSGYFYYHKWPRFTNKIYYNRWSQSWACLALATNLRNNQDG